MAQGTFLNGHVHVFRAIFISHTGGESWQFSHLAKDLIDPIVFGSMISTELGGGPNGSTLIFSNPTAENARTNLSVHLSADGGDHWESVLVLAPSTGSQFNSTSSYSALARLPNGSFVCQYDCGGSYYKTVGKTRERSYFPCGVDELPPYKMHDVFAVFSLQPSTVAKSDDVASDSDPSLVGSGACASDADCSLNGRCVGDRCVCEPGWGGADCHLLRLLPAAPVSKQAYAHYNDSTWGGTVIREGGLYHLYFSEMANNCSLHMCEYFFDLTALAVVRDVKTAT